METPKRSLDITNAEHIGYKHGGIEITVLVFAHLSNLFSHLVIVGQEVIFSRSCWSPDPQLVFANPHVGTQSSALGLFHELGHGYNKISDPRAFYLRSNNPVAGYDDQEEQHVITNYENPAAIKLGETPRTNHNGSLLYSTGATSTTEMFPDIYKINPDGN